MKQTNYRLVISLITACMTTSIARADLVAYFPLNEGTPGTIANTIDDIIDDASHGVTDGTANNDNAMWVNDPTRGVVLSTVNGNRFTAGTQDLDLSEGFTWALWVNSDSNANLSVNDGGTDPNGADVIIGSRNGIWNKVQQDGTQRWFDLPYNLTQDTWEHIVYTGDATNGAAFYINGVVVASDPTPFGADGGTQIVNDVMEIGGSSRFTEDWAGLMSEIGIWNERLGDSDILALATGTAPTDLGGGSDPLFGDYNEDNVVDLADYTVWRNNLGSTNPLPNDNIGGTIGAAQYDQWRSNFGDTAPAIGISNAAVPEPSSFAVLASIAGLGLFKLRT